MPVIQIPGMGFLGALSSKLRRRVFNFAPGSLFALNLTSLALHNDLSTHVFAETRLILNLTVDSLDAYLSAPLHTSIPANSHKLRFLLRTSPWLIVRVCVHHADAHSPAVQAVLRGRLDRIISAMSDARTAPTRLYRPLEQRVDVDLRPAPPAPGLSSTMPSHSSGPKPPNLAILATHADFGPAYVLLSIAWRIIDLPGLLVSLNPDAGWTITGQAEAVRSELRRISNVSRLALDVLVELDVEQKEAGWRQVTDLRDDDRDVYAGLVRKYAPVCDQSRLLMLLEMRWRWRERAREAGILGDESKPVFWERLDCGAWHAEQREQEEAGRILMAFSAAAFKAAERKEGTRKSIRLLGKIVKRRT